MTKKRNPLVSVVIPTINEENYLPRCLDSFKKQTYKNYEIIISDGGSTDNTLKIAKKYNAKVTIYKKSNVTMARQVGVDHARGEIIAGADADTFYPPDHLARIVENFSKNKELIALGGEAIFEKDPLWWYLYWKCFNFLEKWIYKLTGFVVYIPALNLSFRRDAFKRIGGYTTYLASGGDELDIVRRLKKVGKAMYNPELIVYPSSRRVRENFWEVIFVHTIRDYILSYVFGRLFKKPVFQLAPVREKNL